MQTLAVTLIVAVCAVYAAWTLMPAAWRRTLARVLVRQPMLAKWAPLQRAAAGTSGGCGACDACETPPDAGAVKTIRIVRR